MMTYELRAKGGKHSDCMGVKLVVVGRNGKVSVPTDDKNRNSVDRGQAV